METWLGTPHPALRALFRALLLSIEVSPIRFGFGPRTMSALPLPRLASYVAALDAAADPSLDIWKYILGMAYFARPIGAAEMDLVQGPGEPPALHRIGRKSQENGHTLFPSQRPS